MMLERQTDGNAMRTRLANSYKTRELYLNRTSLSTNDRQGLKLLNRDIAYIEEFLKKYPDF